MSDTDDNDRHNAPEYADARRRRLAEGRYRAALRGVMLHKAPFGYRRDEHRRRIIHIEPHEAGLVTHVFAQAAAGASMTAIARELAEGTGRRWHGASVARVLRNPTYVGTMVWGCSQVIRDPATGRSRRVATDVSRWIVVLVAELAIVSTQLWTAANHRLDARRRV